MLAEQKEKCSFKSNIAPSLGSLPACFWQGNWWFPPAHHSAESHETPSAWKGRKRMDLKQVSQLKGFCSCRRNCANIKLDVCSYPSKARSCRCADTAAAPMRTKSDHIFFKEKTPVLLCCFYNLFCPAFYQLHTRTTIDQLIGYSLGLVLFAYYL